MKSGFNIQVICNVNTIQEIAGSYWLTKRRFTEHGCNPVTCPCRNRCERVNVFLCLHHNSSLPRISKQFTPPRTHVCLLMATTTVHMPVSYEEHFSKNRSPSKKKYNRYTRYQPAIERRRLQHCQKNQPCFRLRKRKVLAQLVSDVRNLSSFDAGGQLQSRRTVCQLWKLVWIEKSWAVKDEGRVGHYECIICLRSYVYTMTQRKNRALARADLITGYLPPHKTHRTKNTVKTSPCRHECPQFGRSNNVVST